MQLEGGEITHLHGAFEDNGARGPCVKVSDNLLYEGEMLRNVFHGEGSLVTRGASALTYKVFTAYPLPKGTSNCSIRVSWASARSASATLLLPLIEL